VIGVDTSNEMISMAKFLSLHLAFLKPIVKFFSARAAMICAGTAATFKIGNAENTLLPGRSFDLVTIMYAFHEAPREGRERILQEAYRLLQPGGMLAVIDISTEYTPSSGMLVGEPYGTL
jgi:ubiquinone/menaquinone biosynthesis C-methylase UbiE